MKKKIWTAAVKSLGGGGWFVAQEKSSKANLQRRLERDDPVWVKPTVIYFRDKMLAKKHFKRGLALIYKEHLH